MKQPRAIPANINSAGFKSSPGFLAFITAMNAAAAARLKKVILVPRLLGRSSEKLLRSRLRFI
jgi:hypothetical protein